MVKANLQLKFVENPICLWMPYRAIWRLKVELALHQSQKPKGNAFLENTANADSLYYATIRATR